MAYIAYGISILTINFEYFNLLHDNYHIRMKNFVTNLEIFFFVILLITSDKY